MGLLPEIEVCQKEALLRGGELCSLRDNGLIFGAQRLLSFVCMGGAALRPGQWGLCLGPVISEVSLSRYSCFVFPNSEELAGPMDVSPRSPHPLRYSNHHTLSRSIPETQNFLNKWSQVHSGAFVGVFPALRY